MMHFAPVPEPPDFDARARRPGNLWLTNSANDAKRPKDLWSPFKSQLADGFHKLCGYSAMFDLTGTVDHYLSCENHRSLAYEWSNYRFCSGWINSSKKAIDDQVLDPFQVQDDWFEILLPSLQLVLTATVPPSERDRAEFTLRRLGLKDDERILRQRREWYKLYQEGKLNLEGLEHCAPLIARAVRKQLLKVEPREQ
jgi:hypothetical protein